MANRFSLESSISATIDERSAERAGEDLAETMEQAIGDLRAGVDTGGVGSLGGAAAGSGGGLPAGAGAAGGLAARAAGSGGAAGAAAAAAPVALAGAVGFGLLQGVQTLAGASPALRQTSSILGEAMDLFFRPFGNALSDTIRPFAEEALTMAVNFNDLAGSDGLGVAVAGLSSNAASSFGTAFENSISSLAGGEGTLADALFAGSGTISLSALVTPVGAGAIITAVAADEVFNAVDLDEVLSSETEGDKDPNPDRPGPDDSGDTTVGEDQGTIPFRNRATGGDDEPGIPGDVSRETFKSATRGETPEADISEEVRRLREGIDKFVRRSDVSGSELPGTTDAGSQYDPFT